MDKPSLIFGPVPPESNPPINPQYYQPSQFFITAITLGKTTTVTTSVDHNYVTGQNVRLLIPNVNGSYQLNEVSGYVISVPSSTQVILNIDSSRNVNTFVAASVNQLTKPQILAIGEINSGQINSSGRIQNSTYIPGSFINISPL